MLASRLGLLADYPLGKVGFDLCFIAVTVNSEI
jgi:hypothetical protein